MSVPVRVAVRVDFADGGQHEYEVSSALAVRMAGLGPAVGAIGETAALGAFVEARLAEAARVASLAGESRVAWVTVRGEAGQMLYTTVAADLEGEDDTWIADGRHEIVDVSPTVFYDGDLTRRDIEAKRAILIRWRTACNQADVARVNGDAPEYAAWERISWGLELDVRTLAAVWNEHADYKAAWAL